MIQMNAYIDSNRQIDMTQRQREIKLKRKKVADLLQTPDLASKVKEIRNSCEQVNSFIWSFFQKLEVEKDLIEFVLQVEKPVSQDICDFTDEVLLNLVIRCFKQMLNLCDEEGRDIKKICMLKRANTILGRQGPTASDNTSNIATHSMNTPMGRNVSVLS